MFSRLYFILVFILVCSNTFANQDVLPWYIKDFKTPYFIWEKLPVEIYTDKKLPPSFITSTRKAIANWNESIGNKVFTFKGSSKNCNKKNIHCITLLNKEKYLKTSGRNDYGYTSQFFDKGLWTEADIYLNNSIAWGKDIVGRVSPYDIIVHELGHVLGLQHHNFDLSSIMNYYPQEAGIKHDKISPFDIKLIRSLYFSGVRPRIDKLLFIDGQFKNALAELNKVDSYSDLNSLYLKARLEKKLGKLDQSEITISKAIALSSNAPSFIKGYLLNFKADIYFKRKNNDIALKIFEQSLKVHSTNYHTLSYVGYLRFLKKMPNESVAPLIYRALRIKPSYKFANQILKLIVPRK
jgi:tetratricopeptide (TPR) repeat protein